jgi:uncharacterized repeat protein (TIGR03803 family)
VNGKKQFRNSLLNIIWCVATAALAIAVVFTLAVVLTPSAQAQTPATSVVWTEKLLHSFNDTDGALPRAGLIFDAAGNLYGTTSEGGAYSWGTVFELTPAGGGNWTETVLHSFCSPTDCTDGAYPYAGLIFDAAGNLYGTTVGGGTYAYCSDGYGCGTVFELTPTAGGGWTEQVLYNFGNGTDGVNPYDGLIFDAAGKLYGTTPNGGTYGYGTVFELTPTESGGWTETVLHSFCSQTDCTDGEAPQADLIFDTLGNLYGSTTNGGTYGGGTVFELTPTGGGGWTEKVLHSFCSQTDCTDGEAPQAGLIFDTLGNLYGSTTAGGTYTSNCNYGCGTVFELTPTGGGAWTEQVLHSFGNGTDGYYPFAGLIFDAAGNLYGTTWAGGTYGWGTVFELTPTGGGWTETVLHSFNDNGTDGILPEAGLIFDAIGNLYGTTPSGGAEGEYGGTVFELTPVYPCATCSHAVLQ